MGNSELLMCGCVAYLLVHIKGGFANFAEVRNLSGSLMLIVLEFVKFVFDNYAVGGGAVALAEVKI